MKINFKTIDTFMVFCLMLAIFYSGSALADDSTNAIESVLCKVVNMLTGVAGKAIATLAIVVLGISLFLGKMSWPVAAATAVGVGLIFGAGQMVAWLGGTTSGCSGSG